MAYHIWINGKHTAGTSGKVIEVRNPMTEEIIDTALAAGNTVVIKPSEMTPLSTLLFAELFAYLPPGVVNVTSENEAETIMCEETFGPLWWYLYGKK